MPSHPDEDRPIDDAVELLKTNGFDARIESLRRAHTLEPRNRSWAGRIVLNLVLVHRYDEAMAEIKASEGRDEFMEFLRTQIRVRDHGDLQRMAREVAELHDEFDSQASLDNLVFSYVMAREFEAVEGDTEGAEEYMRQYYRGSGSDWAYRALNRDFTCKILGLAGAADAAVRCLRDGLQEPSLVMPFMEAYLPFYDAIREAPVFVEFIEELERT